MVLLLELARRVFELSVHLKLNALKQQLISVCCIIVIFVERRQQRESKETAEPHGVAGASCCCGCLLLPLSALLLPNRRLFCFFAASFVPFFSILSSLNRKGAREASRTQQRRALC